MTQLSPGKNAKHTDVNRIVPFVGNVDFSHFPKSDMSNIAFRLHRPPGRSPSLSLFEQANKNSHKIPPPTVNLTANPSAVPLNSIVTPGMLQTSFFRWFVCPPDPSPEYPQFDGRGSSF